MSQYKDKLALFVVPNHILVYNSTPEIGTPAHTTDGRCLSTILHVQVTSHISIGGHVFKPLTLHFLPYPIARGVRQIQLALNGFKGHSRLLHHQFHVHGFVGLESYHELISTSAPRGKDIAWGVLELDSYLSLALIQG